MIVMGWAGQDTTRVDVPSSRCATRCCRAGTLQHQRPKLVEIVDCSDITFTGMTYANSPFWTLHPLYCDNLVFRNVTVLAPRPVGNTDGIDPDSCSNVLIDK